MKKLISCLSALAAILATLPAIAGPLVWDKTFAGPWPFLDYLERPVRGKVKEVVETNWYRADDGTDKQFGVLIFTYNRDGKLEKFVRIGLPGYEYESTETAELTWSGDLLKRVKKSFFYKKTKDSVDRSQLIFDHDETGCVNYMEEQDKLYPKPRITRYRCAQAGNIIKRVNLADPSNFAEFSADDGKILRVSYPGTATIGPGGVGTATAIERYEYKRIENNGALMVRKFSGTGGKDESLDIRVFFDERHPVEALLEGGWVAIEGYYTGNSRIDREYLYKYVTVDAQNNWTRRNAWNVKKQKADQDEPEKWDVRKITYYK